MSSRHPIGTASARSYAAAYATHYTQHDLGAALDAYDAVIEQYPTTPEADYSRAQMMNIVRQVVPSRELLASQVALVREYLEYADVASTDPVDDDDDAS